MRGRGDQWRAVAVVFLALSGCTVSRETPLGAGTSQPDPRITVAGGTPTVAARPTPAVDLGVSPTLCGTTEAPGPPLDQTATAASVVPSRTIHLQELPIPWPGSISAMSWLDGRSILLVTGSIDERRNALIERWQYEVPGGELSLVERTTTITPDVWQKLAIVPANLAARGSVSPSGDWMIFVREVLTITPEAVSRPPMPEPVEIRLAKTDGSESVGLGGPYPGCHHLGTVVWFRQEHGAIFSCGYEGPDEIYLANLVNHEVTSLEKVVGFPTQAGTGWMSLSADETTLAFTDYYGILHIVGLDGSVHHTIRFGQVPSWSSDSRRLYYLIAADSMSGGIGGIYVYDLDSEVNSLLLGSPVFAGDGTSVAILPGELAVSPAEDAAVFWNQELWLATWHQ